MPLEVGHKWTYAVRPGLQSFTGTVEVARPIAVADVQGYELAGDLGVSRLAWAHGVLIASETSNARFTPPLPLLDPGRERVRWRGWMESMGKRIPAKAEIVRDTQKIDLTGQMISTTRSVVTMKAGTKKMELSTWFQPGVGIVQQEQRTEGQLDLSMQLLSGG